MATEITVDAKPMAKLPIDPSTIPDAVKKRVAAVEALYAQNGSQQSSPAEPVPPVPGSEPTTPEPFAAQQAPASSAPAEREALRSEAKEPAPLPTQAPPAPEQKVAEPPRPTSPEDNENSKTWKNQYHAMEGRFNASQKMLGEMQEQLAQLGNELLQLQRNPPQPQRLPPPPPSYLTEQDEQNYGRDLIDFTTRAATQALIPHLQQIEQQNAEVQRRLAIEARRNLDARVEAAVPNYREIDRDPRWHNWLRGVDVLSRRVRQQFLDEAITAADAPRVISFFRQFLAEEQATGHIEPAPHQQVAPPRKAAVDLGSIVAPGRARPATGGDASMPPDKPIYSRAQIKQLYEQHRRGAYVGREAEWARQDAEIIAAGREGRIR